jgi:hypothetical protein
MTYRYYLYAKLKQVIPTTMFTPQWLPTNKINRPNLIKITTTIIITLTVILQPIPATFQTTTVI